MSDRGKKIRVTRVLYAKENYPKTKNRRDNVMISSHEIMIVFNYTLTKVLTKFWACGLDGFDMRYVFGGNLMKRN